MPPINKNRGKAPSSQSRVVALETVVLVLVDIVNKLQLDPEEKSKLLASAPLIERQLGLKDTGWVNGTQE